MPRSQAFSGDVKAINLFFLLYEWHCLTFLFLFSCFLLLFFSHLSSNHSTKLIFADLDESSCTGCPVSRPRVLSRPPHALPPLWWSLPSRTSLTPSHSTRSLAHHCENASHGDCGGCREKCGAVGAVYGDGCACKETEACYAVLQW